MRTIIAGSRDIINAELIYASLNKAHELTPITEVVSGGARGPDQIGAAWGVDSGIPVRWFYAEWKTNGRAAGYMRNMEMALYANEAEQRRLIAFWDTKSRGTANIIDLASKFNIDALIIPCEDAIWQNAVEAEVVG